MFYSGIENISQVLLKDHSGNLKNICVKETEPDKIMI